MKVLKVHFGVQPPECDYRPQADGAAEVWIYRNIQPETDADGNTGWVADGVFLTTHLTQAEVLANADQYFNEPEQKTAEERIAELEEELKAAKILLGVE